jgi:hypothetical protein
MHDTFIIAIADTVCIMRPMQLNHSQIIDLWPSLDEFAEDMGVKMRTAQGWKRRNSIPWHYWPRLIACALVRRIYVSPEMLMSSAAERRAA